MRLIPFNRSDFNYDLINLTDHSIFISSTSYYHQHKIDVIYEVEASGIVARVEDIKVRPSFQIKNRKHLDGHNITIYSHQPGRVINLPEPKPKTFYIVSSITAKAIASQFPERRDILSPDSKHIRKMRANGDLPVVFRLLKHKQVH